MSNEPGGPAPLPDPYTTPGGHEPDARTRTAAAERLRGRAAAPCAVLGPGARAAERAPYGVVDRGRRPSARAPARARRRTRSHRRRPSASSSYGPPPRARRTVGRRYGQAPLRAGSRLRPAPVRPAPAVRHPARSARVRAGTAPTARRPPTARLRPTARRRLRHAVRHALRHAVRRDALRLPRRPAAAGPRPSRSPSRRWSTSLVGLVVLAVCPGPSASGSGSPRCGGSARNGKQGRGMAIAGIVVGSLGILYLIAVVAFFIAGRQRRLGRLRGDSYSYGSSQARRRRRRTDRRRHDPGLHAAHRPAWSATASTTTPTSGT